MACNAVSEEKIGGYFAELGWNADRAFLFYGTVKPIISFNYLRVQL